MISKFAKYLVLLGLFLIQRNFEIKAQLVIGEFPVDTHSIAQALDTPWEILWGPDDHIWVTERYGRVSKIDPSSGELFPLITIADVYEESESGLLGIALHPDFSEKPYVYVVYNYLDGTIRERVVRYTYSGIELLDPLVLLDNIPGGKTHNGSRILVGPDEKLYFSFGDVGVNSHSQDISSLNGKILRMNLDGSIPEDNPFPDSYIWSYGHRNPQGLVFTPEGKLYSSEHGPSNDDEVNLIQKGKNYGWPDVEGFCDNGSEETFCIENAVVEPLVAWTPTLAVAGLDYYPFDLIPSLQNKLLLVSLRTGKFISLELSEDGNAIVKKDAWINGEFGRLRDLCVAPDGRIFISTSNQDGRGNPKPGDDKIIEIKSSGSNSSDIIESNSLDFTIYPNPASEWITVKLNFSFTQVKYSVFHSSGKLMMSGFLSGNSERINTNEIPQGFYYVQIIVDQQVIIKPFVTIH